MALGANYNRTTGQPDPNGVYMTHKQAESLRSRYKTRDMTQKQVVESLVKAQPELNRQPSGSVNILEYLKQKPQSSDPRVKPVRWMAQSTKDVIKSEPIKIEEIKNTSWMRPVKKHEERAASRARTIAIQNKTPQLSSQSRSGARGAGANYPEYVEQQEEIIETQKNIQETMTREISDVVEGRVIRPTLNEPQKETIIIETPEPIEEKNNNNLLIIGGLAVIAIVGFFIIRRMKK